MQADLSFCCYYFFFHVFNYFCIRLCFVVYVITEKELLAFTQLRFALNHSYFIYYNNYI